MNNGWAQREFTLPVIWNLPVLSKALVICGVINLLQEVLVGMFSI